MIFQHDKFEHVKVGLILYKLWRRHIVEVSNTQVQKSRNLLSETEHQNYLHLAYFFMQVDPVWWVMNISNWFYINNAVVMWQLCGFKWQHEYFSLVSTIHETIQR